MDLGLDLGLIIINLNLFKIRNISSGPNGNNFIILFDILGGGDATMQLSFDPNSQASDGLGEFRPNIAL